MCMNSTVYYIWMTFGLMLCEITEQQLQAANKIPAVCTEEQIYLAHCEVRQSKFILAGELRTFSFIS